MKVEILQPTSMEYADVLDVKVCSVERADESEGDAKLLGSTARDDNYSFVVKLTNPERIRLIQRLMLTGEKFEKQGNVMTCSTVGAP